MSLPALAASARIDHRLHLGGRQSAALGDVGHHAAPHIVEQFLQLFTTLGAHVLARERLDRRLVFANARHLHADPVFLKRPRKIHRLACEPRHQNQPVGIEGEFARGRREIVALRRRLREIGPHRLARGPERHQRRAHFLERRVARAVGRRV